MTGNLHALLSTDLVSPIKVYGPQYLLYMDTALPVFTRSRSTMDFMYRTHRSKGDFNHVFYCFIYYLMGQLSYVNVGPLKALVYGFGLL